MRAVPFLILACLVGVLTSLVLTAELTSAQDEPLVRADAIEQEVGHLNRQGRYAEALPMARKVLALREQALGSAHPEVALSLNNLADLLLSSGDYPAARPLYERALNINEHSFGPNHHIVAITLNNLAALLQTAGDYAAAKPLYERALNIWEKELGPNHPDVALGLNNLAELLRLTGRYASARPLYERAIRIREQALGANHPDVAQTLNNLALLFQATGDYDTAKRLLERALEIWGNARGPMHPDVATGLNNLAGLFQAIGDSAAAKPLLERALTIREGALGPNHPLVAQSLSNLGAHLRSAGQYEAARILLERALTIREQVLGSDHPSIATSLNSLAQLSQDVGDYAAARLFLERALNIRERVLGPNHPDVAASLSNLALLFQTSGDNASARPVLERALNIQEQALGPTHPDVATTLNNFAVLLETMGDYEGAWPLHERALKIREQVLGPNHPGVAVSLNNIAALLRASGDYAAAKSLLERALSILVRVLGPAHPDVARGLDNLAVVLQLTGEYSAAGALHEQALAIREQALGPVHPIVATSLNNLGGLMLTLGNYDAARSLIERALRITEGALGPNHPDAVMRLKNFAILEWADGRPQYAVAKLVRAMGITRANTAKGLVGLSQRQKRSLLETTGGVTDLFLSLPPDLVDNSEAFRSVLERKNLLFRTLASERALIETGSNPRVHALLAEYAAVRRQLAALSISVPALRDLTQYHARLAGLNQRLETVEVDLSRMSSAFHQVQLEVAKGTLEVCRAVPIDAALIDLFWYGRYVSPAATGTRSAWTAHYAAFVLRGGDCATPIRVDLGPAAPIDEDVRRLREAMSREAADPATRALRGQYRRTVADRLGAKLFPPVLWEAIAGKSSLIIAPDGALALLPFALLPGEDGHEFLLERRTISYIPSGRDLIRAKGSKPNWTGLLAVGDPAFDRAPVQTVQAGSTRAGCGTVEEPFTPLPGTAAELQAITRAAQQARPMQAVTVLERAQASKAAFLDQAPKARVLHLATHAYFAGEECTPAGLMSLAPRFGMEPPVFLGHNPLLLAGIALAGANDREKADGILTALEITAMDLRNTNLVVLSACDTGLGTPARGQELLGLRWAFTYAGAKNTVTSLWSVPDTETATLMAHFYENLWIKNLPVFDALRAAQLDMLRAAREQGDPAPHAWAAFVASGLPD